MLLMHIVSRIPEENSLRWETPCTWAGKERLMTGHRKERQRFWKSGGYSIPRADATTAPRTHALLHMHFSTADMKVITELPWRFLRWEKCFQKGKVLFLPTFHCELERVWGHAKSYWQSSVNNLWTRSLAKQFQIRRFRNYNETKFWQIAPSRVWVFLTIKLQLA